MISIDSIKTEAITHFQNLLKINTTNPPGNEIEAVNYLSRILTAENIQHVVLESKPGRANLVARLAGNGDLRPLLLTSHLDVVPANAHEWKVPPFSGEIRDNCIWGRGAIDMKNMTAMQLAILLSLKRSGIKLKRDIIFLAVSDEEAGCKHGSEWMVKNHPELIRAEYALNEVGGFSLYLGKKTFYPIGVTEKGLCWFRIFTQGTSGHGSLPHEDQAILHLTQVTSQLQSDVLPVHMTKLVSQFILGLSKAASLPQKIILKLLSQPALTDFLLKKIPDRKKALGFNALVRNTITPTVLRAGEKINVIPSLSSVEVDGRLIPGQTIEDLFDEVRKVVEGNYHFELIRGWSSPPESPQNDFYKLLKNSLCAADNEAIVVPYLIPGFTDAAFLSKLGIQCYGFSPVKLDRDMVFSELFHGVNERIPVEGFLFGLKVLANVVLESCTL